MAALSVVQNRLAAIGLAPFCLEIHSNKTKKSAVISQLRETTEIIRQTLPKNFRKEAERLLQLTGGIESDTSEALHKEYPFRQFLYTTPLSTINQRGRREPCFDIPQAYLDTLDQRHIRPMGRCVELC